MAANYATAMERRRLLTQDFGSSKQKKAMQSQQDNLVNVDTVVGGARLLQQIMPSTNDGEEVEVGRNSSMSESNRRAIQEQRHLHAATADGTNAIQVIRHLSLFCNIRSQNLRKLLIGSSFCWYTLFFIYIDGHRSSGRGI
jgi:hypothetical protein